ncbi:LysR substrate-binding domain-containing protein [Streptomyces sp. MZ04]|uniref:LysR substrate-binding domain-containing protein n=1 Tax=Streptomyces sp. MZ04 TaxID=2559236 RepID=UPI00107EB20B|nr:LysR substrate-binding domain-containing protein [Streptomyces sp. MZ04]TGB03368.1 LysR family transcriptional regulator [Streptomyces sp. MZ04]
MFDVRRLRLLRDLSLYGTVTATAEALHLSGPAVSQQLATLEKEAGLPLLEKQGRTLRLTAAGRLLVEHAEVILGGLSAAEADLRALRAGHRGVVRVAVFPSAARALLPRVWRTLTGDHEAASPELRIAEHEPGPAVDALRRREADLAVVHAYSLLPRVLPPGCEQHRLLDDPVLLALHPETAARLRLEPGRKADLARVADENWLLPGPETSCHELTQRACGAAGFVPRATALASDFSVLTALVGAAAGVALVPRMALPADTTGISLHPLARPVTRTVSVLNRTGDARQPHLALVLDALRLAASEADMPESSGRVRIAGGGL